MRRLSYLALCLALTGCQPATSERAATTGPHSDRGGIGVLSSAISSGGDSSAAPNIDPRRSLAVTDSAILSSFSLTEVLDRIAAQSGGGVTSTSIFRQWWDSANPAPGAGTFGPHCDPASNPTINHYGYQCPRGEGQQAFASNGFDSTPAAYKAIGLFNRFDLAPGNGSDCGEYRIAFAKTSSSSIFGRNLLIFEAVLPNPHPELGLAGCGPVAQFWAGLTSNDSITSRAGKLHDFYFQGLPGFEPVVHVDHYGGGAAGIGQIRSNQFITQIWLLREFKLKRCISGGGVGCGVTVNPVTVKTNPFGPLFNPSSTLAEAPAFRSAFVAAVETLAVNDVNGFSYAPADSFNAAESNEQSNENNYVSQLGPATSPLRQAIQARLTTIGSSLTPDNIVARATAMSCAGCHQLSNNANLGGGIIWPSLQGFTQVSEFTETGPDGPRFQISNALTNVFLPHRKKILESFLVSITPAPGPCSKKLPNCCGVLVCAEDADACPVICLPPPEDQ